MLGRQDDRRAAAGIALPAWRLRDHLREHPEAARQYAACKRDLARRHGTDRVAYTEEKAGFITELLRAAHPPEGV